jgi:hypothetical protein
MAGFVAGFTLSRFVSMRIVVLVGVVIALAWGIGVGWNDRSLVTALGGVGLAGANYAIGALVGRLGRNSTMRSDEVRRQRGM